jgi:hypothetical protein
MVSVLLLVGLLNVAQTPSETPAEAGAAPPEAPASAAPSEAPAAAAPSETPTSAAPAEAPAAAVPSETPAAGVSSETPASAAPAETPAAAAPVAPPREKAVKKAEKPRPPRAWWSTWGIVAGLATSAVAAAVFVGGVATQVAAFYFWYDQTNADRRYDERQFATSRARAVQWIALGLLGGGIAAFFGGLVGATYAFGLGNPDPKSAKDL